MYTIGRVKIQDILACGFLDDLLEVRTSMNIIDCLCSFLFINMALVIFLFLVER